MSYFMFDIHHDRIWGVSLKPSDQILSPVDWGWKYFQGKKIAVDGCRAYDVNNFVCVCVCVYILPPWRLFPSARCPRHTWGHGSTILCCEYQLTALCQVPSSPYLKMSYFTSKDENSSRSISGEKTIWYNTLCEKMIYIDIENKSAHTKPTSYEKILKIRRLL